MKRVLCTICLVLSQFLIGCGDSTSIVKTGSESGLKGADDIVVLAKSGKNEQDMLLIVEKSSAPYILSADDIIVLKKDGVPDKVVVAMLYHKR
jgi:hypothetical protein